MAPHGLVEPALICQSVMTCREMDVDFMNQLRDMTFGDLEENWSDLGGSPFQRWYHDVAQGSTAVRQPCANGRIADGRVIAWKKGKPFRPENVFFRTVDTQRLLPMAKADYRVQVYSDQSTWDRLDGNAKPGFATKNWIAMTLAGMLHEMLLMRNVHDRRPAEIPLVLVGWEDEYLDQAFDYWVRLSEGEWSDEERFEEFLDCQSQFPKTLRPCFLQTDLLVRALLSDSQVSYVPPFIVFFPARANARGRALFTDPSHEPCSPLINDFPESCGGAGCDDPDCHGFFDFRKSRSLASDNWLVRKGHGDRNKVVRCNYWACNVEEEFGYTGKSVFSACNRCKEVLYCGKEHQTDDWSTHKKVCENPPIFTTTGTTSLS